MFRILCFLVLSVIGSLASAQKNRIDLVDDAAPELARFGNYDVGVMTFEVVDQDRIDILNTQRGSEAVFYDRKLTLEIWYPADLQGADPGTQYRVVTRNPTIIATLSGRAVRDAEPLRAEGPYPLIIISHGYPGNRFLMSHRSTSAGVHRAIWSICSIF